MTELDFSGVEAIVIDSQLHATRLAREMLNRIGIKKTEVFDEIETATSFLASASPDIILVDCDGALEADSFKLVRAIRNDMSAINPYAGIIVTTWQPTQLQVMRATNSGADAVLIKPFSPRQMLDRVMNLIDGRQRFVVTSDFVGPDRRKSPREGSQIPLIDVPNTLRMKVTGQFGQISLRQVVADTNALVNAQKCIRSAIQVGFLIDYALEGLAGPAPERSALDHVARIPGVLDDFERRAREACPGEVTPYSAAVRDAVARVLTEAAAGPVSKATAKALWSAGTSLMCKVDTGRSEEEIHREVRTAVAAYRVRLEAMAQAKMAPQRAG